MGTPVRELDRVRTSSTDNALQRRDIARTSAGSSLAALVLVLVLVAIFASKKRSTASARGLGRLRVLAVILTLASVVYADPPVAVPDPLSTLTKGVPKGSQVMWNTADLNARLGTSYTAPHVTAALTGQGYIPVSEIGVDAKAGWTPGGNVRSALEAAKAGPVFDLVPNSTRLNGGGTAAVATIETGAMTGKTGMGPNGVGVYTNGHKMPAGFSEQALPQRLPAVGSGEKIGFSLSPKDLRAPTTTRPSILPAACEVVRPPEQPTASNSASKGASPKGAMRGGALVSPAIGVGVALFADDAAEALFPVAAENRRKYEAMKQGMREADYADERLKRWRKGIGLDFKSMNEVNAYLSKHSQDYVDFKNCTVDSSRYPDGEVKRGFGQLSFEALPDPNTVWSDALNRRVTREEAQIIKYFGSTTSDRRNTPGAVGEQARELYAEMMKNKRVLKEGEANDVSDLSASERELVERWMPGQTRGPVPPELPGLEEAVRKLNRNQPTFRAFMKDRATCGRCH